MTDHRADLAQRLEGWREWGTADGEKQLAIDLLEAAAELRRPAAAEVEEIQTRIRVWQQSPVSYQGQEAELLVHDLTALLRRLPPAEEGWRPIVREWQDARKAVAQFDGVKDVRVDGDFEQVLTRLANAESALAELALPEPEKS